MLSRNENNVVALFHVGYNCADRRFHLSANTIACYRYTVLFADGKSKFALIDVGTAVEHDEILVSDTLGVLVNVVVLKVFFKSVYRLQN